MIYDGWQISIGAVHLGLRGWLQTVNWEPQFFSTGQELMGNLSLNRLNRGKFSNEMGGESES